jgi:hypothetical protein
MVDERKRLFQNEHSKEQDLGVTWKWLQFGVVLLLAM